MAISHKLDVKQGQHLVMTPQLQQAIKLLQLTNLELAEFVDDQLEQNPFLERDESATASQRGDGSETTAAEAPQSTTESELTLSGQDAGVDASAVLDTDYDNIDPSASISEKSEDMRSDDMPSEWSSVTTSKNNDFSYSDMDANLTKEISLHDHLTDQLNLSVSNEMDLMIGVYLIDMIDEAGYLRGDLEQVAVRLGADEADVLQVVYKIQKFDPVGVGARNLQECLQLQLEELNRFDPLMELLINNLQMLGKADISGLKNF